MPMPVDRLGVGDYLHGRPPLRPAGQRRTRAAPRRSGRARLPARPAAARAGLETARRWTLRQAIRDGRGQPTRDYLRAHGYGGEQPWTDHVIGSVDAQGAFASAGTCAMPRCRPRARRGLGVPDHARHRPHPRAGASSPGPCTCKAHQNRTGPTRRRRLPRAVRRRDARRRCAGAGRTPRSAPPPAAGESQSFARDEVWRGATGLHGPGAADRRRDRPADGLPGAIGAAGGTR